MKILTISNYFPSHSGGIEIVAQNLVSRWRNENEVHWVACDISSSESKYENGNIPLPSNNFTEEHLGFPYPIPSLKSILQVIAQVHWSDIVHIHDCLYLANLIAFITSHILSKPIVVTQHIGYIHYKEIYKNILQFIAYSTIGKIVLERANKVVFINNKVKFEFSTKMKIQRHLLIENGVDHNIFFPPSQNETKSIRAYLGLPKNEKILLFVGRFTQKKGLHLIQEFAKARPNYLWIMVGQGEVDVSLWGLNNVIVFPPQNQKKLRDFYIATDLLILPSWGEGFPLTIQEAMACGAPAAVSEDIAISVPDAPLISLDISSPYMALKTLDESLNNLHFLEKRRKEVISYAQKWNWDIVADLYNNHFIETLLEHKNLA